jgi:plastocyanin
MTDTTTTDEPGESAVEPAPAADVATETTPAEKVPFWDRPLVERFVTPFVIPVVVIVGLVVYIINISRLFLASHGDIPVILGTTITVLILVGATMLSAAPRARSGMVSLVSAGFLLLVMSSGWLLVGAAENKEHAVEALPPDLKAGSEIATTAAPGGQLAFAPSQLSAETGLVKVDVQVAAPGHTFAFTDPETLLGVLNLDGGQTSGIAYVGAPGDYEFICTITGHAEGGMRGVLTVEGEAVPTLEEAVEKAGNPPLEG